MTIKLNKIYAQLKAWRDKLKITAESQKETYLRNIMKELGQLEVGLRDYDNWSKCDLRFFQIHKAEREIIDTICNIAVLTINAGMELPSEVQPLIIEPKDEFSVADIFVAIADFIRTDANGSPFNYYDFARILKDCAGVCKRYGFNFEIAMLEHIKQISSNTGKEYKANYDLARI